MRIKIDGEIYTVKDVYTRGYLPLITTEGQEEFYLAADSETAGEVARRRWEEMAQDDPKEFTCMVGEETLIAWGLEQWAGPGSTHVCSLQDWLDLWLDTPEEEFASYDSRERTVDRCGKLTEELGFTPTVAYRHN